MKFSAKFREEHIDYAQSKVFDVLIIGGGITGAGVARELALRGKSFCMLDKNDFAFGTSSRSSKLAHGGLRYLSSREYRLVQESTTERNWLRAHFPNMVRPFGFFYNSFEKGKDRPKHIIISLVIYDLLSNWKSKFKNYRTHRFFSPKYMEEIEPQYSQYDPDLGRLKISGFYYDTNIDDARLTVETIKESLAYSKGTSVAINYARVTGFIRNTLNKICGALVEDQINGTAFEIKANAVVACGGIWTDEIMKQTDFPYKKIYPTKGVHVAVPNERVGNHNGFGLRSFDDERYFFVLRRGKITLIGTTDTDYYRESDNLDDPWCTKEDCDYLFRTVNRMFPHARLTYKDIIGTYAGIRPLIKQDDVVKESAVSREHEIFESKDGVISIAGGKLTTFRLMAEELIFKMVEKGYLREFAKQEHAQKEFSKVPFITGMTRKDFDRQVGAKNLARHSWPDQLEYLHQQFGKQGIDILENINSNPEKGSPLLDGYPISRAEMEFILENENAPHLIDVLCRRTEAQWTIWHYLQEELAENVADIMAEYYGWTKAKRKAEIKNYMAYVKKTIWFASKKPGA